MSNFIEVNKETFLEYIDKYQKENNIVLSRDVFMACEPPLISYNDFSTGKVYPESIIAKSIPSGYLEEPPEYFILK